MTEKLTNGQLSVFKFCQISHFVQIMVEYQIHLMGNYG